MKKFGRRLSSLQLYARPNLTITSGSGCYLYDSNGKKYLDMNAGIAVNALGHGDAGLVKVVSEQASKLIHLSNLYHNEHAESFAKMIASSARCSDPKCPGTGVCTSCSEPQKGRLHNAKVYFGNSGTEANEAAIKFARRYGKAVNPSGSKHKVVSFHHSFHGRTMGSLSATPGKYQAPFTPMVPGFVYGTLNECTQGLIDDDTCAVIVEPIQGEGGIFAASKLFLEFLRAKCDEHNAVLIFDEIQCGIGRTGSLFAYEQTGVIPDCVTMAKPMANGIPIGAALLSDQIASKIQKGDHGTTFGGSPFATLAGKYVWNRISDPLFLDHVKKMGTLLKSKCLELHKTSPLIVDIRGVGLMIGIQLRENVSTQAFIDRCRDLGVLVISAGENTIRLVPPLIISEPEINEAILVFEKVLSSMESAIARGETI